MTKKLIELAGTQPLQTAKTSAIVNNCEANYQGECWAPGDGRCTHERKEECARYHILQSQKIGSATLSNVSPAGTLHTSGLYGHRIEPRDVDARAMD